MKKGQNKKPKNRAKHKKRNQTIRNTSKKVSQPFDD